MSVALRVVRMTGLLLTVATIAQAELAKHGIGGVNQRRSFQPSQNANQRLSEYVNACLLGQGVGSIGAVPVGPPASQPAPPSGAAEGLPPGADELPAIDESSQPLPQEASANSSQPSPSQEPTQPNPPQSVADTVNTNSPTPPNPPATTPNSESKNVQLAQGIFKRCASCHNVNVGQGSTLADLTLSFGPDDDSGVPAGRKTGAAIYKAVTTNPAMKGILSKLTADEKTALLEWSKAQ